VTTTATHVPRGERDIDSSSGIRTDARSSKRFFKLASRLSAEVYVSRLGRSTDILG
jgi:hypothetical protein